MDKDKIITVFKEEVVNHTNKGDGKDSHILDTVDRDHIIKELKGALEFYAQSKHIEYYDTGDDGLGGHRMEARVIDHGEVAIRVLNNCFPTLSTVVREGE